MTLNDYQDRTNATAIYPEGEGLTYVSLGLAGEAGEFAGKLAKAIRDDAGAVTPERRVELLSELGDVLWFVAQAASRLDATLGTVANANLAKLAGRAARGTIGGSGDQR